MTHPGTAGNDARPAASEDCSACVPPDRTLGVLLVHGMGEQKPGDHVEKVVRSLVASWSADYEVRRVYQEPVACPTCRRPPGTAAQEGDGVGAEARAAKDGPQIIARVQVGGGQNETVDLHFHEVWWADLGVRTGLWNWCRFLGWVLRAPFPPLPGRNRRVR